MPTAQVLREIRRATRPYGVARADRLRLTQRQLDRCVATGALLRPHQGVYVDPAVPTSPLRSLAIAVAAGGAGAAAWGRSAAAVWGLVAEHPATPEIVVPTRRQVRPPGVVVHRSKELRPAHVMIRQGISVTKPIITAIDLAVVVSPLELADALITARRAGLFEPSAVGAMVRELSRPGRTGLRNTRTALELVMIGERPAESVLELRFHVGPGRMLPPYEYQWPVNVDGKQHYIDFAYPDVRLAIEVDGYAKRDSRQALERDDARQNRLLRAGWRVLRFTWHSVVHEPAAVAAEILASLSDLSYRFGR